MIGTVYALQYSSMSDQIAVEAFNLVETQKPEQQLFSDKDSSMSLTTAQDTHLTSSADEGKAPLFTNSIPILSTQVFSTSTLLSQVYPLHQPRPVLLTIA